MLMVKMCLYYGQLQHLNSPLKLHTERQISVVAMVWNLQGDALYAIVSILIMQSQERWIIKLKI